MGISEKLYLATKAFEKKWDYETVLYGDDLCNSSDPQKDCDEIWEYINEIEETGRTAFYNKYSEHKLF